MRLFQFVVNEQFKKLSIVFCPESVSYDISWSESTAKLNYSLRKCSTRLFQKTYEQQTLVSDIFVSFQDTVPEESV